jgi:hypothetical protein
MNATVVAGSLSIADARVGSGPAACLHERSGATDASAAVLKGCASNLPHMSPGPPLAEPAGGCCRFQPGHSLCDCLCTGHQRGTSCSIRHVSSQCHGVR